jgi:hypothetical protein
LATFRQITKENTKRLNRLIDRGGVSRLKKLYDQAQAEFESKLSKRFGANAKTFTTAQMRMFQAMVRQGQMTIAKNMGDVLAAATEETKADALRGAIKDFKQLEKKFTGIATPLPVEEASRFAGVLGKNTSLIKRHSTQLMGKAGVKTIRQIEQELALSMMTGETIGAAIDRIQKVTGKAWYQAERIVRTEQAWAFNATHAAAIADAADELPDIMMRWTELVDDVTGRPLDDRVAQDSIAMHGQVAKPGGSFTMPNKAQVPVALWGKSWEHPPNRPNDRATLQPWRPHWGIPGWVLRNGRRVSLAHNKRKR